MITIPNDMIRDIPHDATSHAKKGHLLRWPSETPVLATFSDDFQYCYSIEQTWELKRPTVMWIIPSPTLHSVAIADTSTLKTGAMSRCMRFGTQLIGHIFAYRTEVPNRLIDVPDPEGPDNLEMLLQMAKRADMVIVGYGKLQRSLVPYAGRVVRSLMNAGHDLYALRLSSTGTPVHPLSRGKVNVPVFTQPFLWRRGLRKGAQSPSKAQLDPSTPITQKDGEES